MIELAGLFAAVISALSSLVLAYKAARDESRQVRKSTFKEIEKRAEHPLKVGGKAIANVIDDEVLETILEDINRSLATLKNALRDTKSSGEQKDLQLKIAERNICEALSRIMQLNNGCLPTKRLERMWISHACRDKTKRKSQGGGHVSP